MFLICSANFMVIHAALVGCGTGNGNICITRLWKWLIEINLSPEIGSLVKIGPMAGYS